MIYLKKWTCKSDGLLVFLTPAFSVTQDDSTVKKQKQKNKEKTNNKQINKQTKTKNKNKNKNKKQNKTKQNKQTKKNTSLLDGICK